MHSTTTIIARDINGLEVFRQDFSPAVDNIYQITLGENITDSGGKYTIYAVYSDDSGLVSDEGSVPITLEINGVLQEIAGYILTENNNYIEAK